MNKTLVSWSTQNDDGGKTLLIIESRVVIWGEPFVEHKVYCFGKYKWTISAPGIQSPIQPYEDLH